MGFANSPFPFKGRRHLWNFTIPKAGQQKFYLHQAPLDLGCHPGACWQGLSEFGGSVHALDDAVDLRQLRFRHFSPRVFNQCRWDRLKDRFPGRYFLGGLLRKNKSHKRKVDNKNDSLQEMLRVNKKKGNEGNSLWVNFVPSILGPTVFSDPLPSPSPTCSVDL